MGDGGGSDQGAEVGGDRGDVGREVPHAVLQHHPHQPEGRRHLRHALVAERKVVKINLALLLCDAEAAHDIVVMTRVQSPGPEHAVLELEPVHFRAHEVVVDLLLHGPRRGLERGQLALEALDLRELCGHRGLAKVRSGQDRASCGAPVLVALGVEVLAPRGTLAEHGGAELDEELLQRGMRVRLGALGGRSAAARGRGRAAGGVGGEGAEPARRGHNGALRQPLQARCLSPSSSAEVTLLPPPKFPRSFHALDLPAVLI